MGEIERDGPAVSEAAADAAGSPMERATGGPPRRDAACRREAAGEAGYLTTPFAHESEREFAKILDFYEIQWLYEPRTFQLRWDADQRPIESSTPDFYLPEFDLYIELTTLRQSLVTKKNRKLRRLRDLYPDVNIKLLYNRDFRSLMAKYGARRARSS